MLGEAMEKAVEKAAAKGRARAEDVLRKELEMEGYADVAQSISTARESESRDVLHVDINCTETGEFYVSLSNQARGEYVSFRAAQVKVASTTPLSPIKEG